MRFWDLFRNLKTILDRLSRIERAQSQLNRKAEIIMGKQADLDAIVVRIDNAVAGIRQDIADIKAANPEVDFSALEAKVGTLEGLDSEYPGAPQEPTNPENPENPVEPQR
ncbi:hypothetical protein ACIBCT_21310 [Streptosporangium sp. NPDC050855]|uniref:hypothetical protein n=1 Tax=Streptosporangium sp. NPDC050855 TaxID=3366194 RepID=UPI0037A17225